MNIIEELCTRHDLVPDPTVFTSAVDNMTAFQRISRDIAEGDLGRQIEKAMRKQSEDWSYMAHQVVGCEHF